MYIYIFMNKYMPKKVICLDIDMKMDVRIYIYMYMHVRAWSAMSKSRARSKKYLHRRVFTERNLYAQKLWRREILHRKVFTHRNFDAQMPLWRAETFTQGTFTPRLHKKVHKRIYTQKSLRAEIFTNKKNSTEKSLYRRIFTHKRFYTRSLYGQKMHWETFALPTSAFPSVHLCVSICPYCPKFNF